jgi:hypothetical protein
LFVIVGKMVDWSFPVTVSLKIIGLGRYTYDMIHPVNAIISAGLALIIARGFAVGNGIISLLRLSAEIALSEAAMRDAERHRSADEAIGRVQERDGYGKYIDLKH